MLRFRNLYFMLNIIPHIFTSLQKKKKKMKSFLFSIHIYLCDEINDFP